MAKFSQRDPEQLQKQLLELKSLMDFFKQELGVYTYVSYGMLLGAIREKDLVPHETDIDICYLSNENKITNVRKELQEICNKLIEKDLLSKIWIRGKAFKKPSKINRLDFSGQMHVATLNKMLNIDVFSSFIDQNNKFHMTRRIQGQLEKTDIVPFKTTNIRGINFNIPNHSEKVLNYIYGKQWIKPLPNTKSTVVRKPLWTY